MNPTVHPPRTWIVFADDWGRHPSSCQHLVRQVLPHRDVIWVNTIGTRPPRVDWSTAKRVAGKLKEWASPRSHVEANPASIPVSVSSSSLHPRTLAPKMWPSFRSSFGRSLNRRLLVRSLRPLVESLPQAPIVVTTLPLVADLVNALPIHRWIYYCVDDFSVWPGYDGETMLRMERELVPKVDEIIAVSDTLVSHIAKFHRTARLLTHGVDLDHWRPTVPATELLPDSHAPHVVFWGVVDRRMDAEFLSHLSANLGEGTIHLIGPQEDPDPIIHKLPNVAVHPAQPFERLPAIAAAATVLVMPYIDAPVTRAMQPLKLKEYMATGKPVVVRSLPSTTSWAEAVDVAENADQFTTRVKERITTGLPEGQSLARKGLTRESWAEKAALFANWVEGES